MKQRFIFAAVVLCGFFACSPAVLAQAQVSFPHVPLVNGYGFLLNVSNPFPVDISDNIISFYRKQADKGLMTVNIQEVDLNQNFIGTSTVNNYFGFAVLAGQTRHFLVSNSAGNGIVGNMVLVTGERAYSYGYNGRIKIAKILSSAFWVNSSRTEVEAKPAHFVSPGSNWAALCNSATDTGVALLNRSARLATVTITVMHNAAPGTAGKATFTLEGGDQIAKYLWQFVPGLQPPGDGGYIVKFESTESLAVDLVNFN